MQTPSIESIFVRKQDERSHPIAKRLHDAPLFGSVARAWIRATRNGGPQAHWASLPPVAA